jgi:hypothetical protein
VENELFADNNGAMENVVPGVLLRLKATDIIHMAGLTTASLGQEYCHMGAVLKPQRQGASLSGTVRVAHASSRVALALIGELDEDASAGESRRYDVSITIQSTTSWDYICTCNERSERICAHAAALLYYWLAEPTAFVPIAQPAKKQEPERLPAPPKQSLKSYARPQAKSYAPAAPSIVETGQAPARAPEHETRITLPAGKVVELLQRYGQEELRSLAREYELTVTGLNKQQIIMALLEALQQPEAIRRVAASLEKAPRQLLAVITLSGGTVSEGELRGLYERFSLSRAGQLQDLLQVLQAKGLLFRKGLSREHGWFVPEEVRAALRVTVPISHYALSVHDIPEVSKQQLQKLLSELLLLARALDGYLLSTEEREWLDQTTRDEQPVFSNHLPEALLQTAQQVVSRPAEYLSFLVRLLRLAGFVLREEERLRVLPDCTALLLGPSSMQTARTLFDLWLKQTALDELQALQAGGIRVAFHRDSLNRPLLRAGELESENCEARQTLIALLTRVPFGQWVTFAPFARFVYRLNPLFLQHRQRLNPQPHWWLETDDRHPLRPQLWNDWSRAEKVYLEYLLRGPLSWWGLCATVVSAEQQVQAFCLLPQAKHLLFADALPEPAFVDFREGLPLVEIENTTTLRVAPGAQAWPILDRLESFLQPAGVDQGKLLYRLSPGKMAAALDRGMRPEPLLELLEALQETRADESLRALLAQVRHWLNCYGRARLYTGVTILETADPGIMAELTAQVDLEEKQVLRIQPTMAIVRNEMVDQLIEELKRRGQTPLLHTEGQYGVE